MRKKCMTIAMAMMMCAVLGTACGKTDKSQKNDIQLETQVDAKEGESISEITEIDEDHLLLETKNEEGEDVTLTLTEDTIIEKEVMPDPAGNKNQKQDPPDKPGNEDQNQTPPDKPGNENQNQNPPDKPGNGDQKQTPPDKPGNEDQNQTPSDKPGNEDQNQTPSGNPGNHPFRETEKASIADLAKGDTITYICDENGIVSKITIVFNHPGDLPPSAMGQPGEDMGNIEYQAVTKYTSDTQTDGESYESTGKDENAILITDHANVSLYNSNINRSSSDSTGGDNSSFYGIGAALLTTQGTVTLNQANIQTDAKGAAGVFAYMDGSITIADSNINTKQDTSGGIHVAGGGSIIANNLTVETNGASSAAIRSDRGGGSIVVEGGSYTSNGNGSPAIYSTADIEVSDATLTATNSEAICIEGMNSIRLTNCKLSGNMPENDQNDCTWNVILYQSMSGDSQIGNSTFSMTGGTLKAEKGGMFYTTNTESTFELENVEIQPSKENPFFLKCTGNSNQRGWGQAGQNGADCDFTATQQKMEGNILWDSISQLDLQFKDNSTFTGAILQDESNVLSTGKGHCNLTIDKDSTWIVTGDSALTTLDNQGSIMDLNGKTVTIQNESGEILVKGKSTFTITVNEMAKAN